VDIYLRESTAQASSLTHGRQEQVYLMAERFSWNCGGLVATRPASCWPRA